jgi:hypothetical protein
MSEATTGQTYSTATIAKLLMMTERHVRRLTAEGILPGVGPGRFEWAPVVQSYIRYLRDRSPGGDAGEEVTRSKGRLINARARAAEIEADMLERSSLDRAAVEQGGNAVLEMIRTRMLAIPSAVAGPAFVAGSLAEVSSLLTAAVNDALDDASRPPVYDAPVALESDAEPHTQTTFGEV